MSDVRIRELFLGVRNLVTMVVPFFGYLAVGLIGDSMQNARAMRRRSKEARLDCDVEADAPGEI